ncbi:MAG: hypothetical protein GWP10_06775, partial [Nitrospiraceae bacterium]|nr:hypothetical protein [Nitrospiraceae bacterium]
MWHLFQFSKRFELLIKPSNFGYNSYDQVILVKISDQVITYLNNYYDIGFVDINGSILYYYPKKFFPETNEVEYYVNMESVDDINYTSLFVYYDVINSIDEPTQEFKLSTFGEAYVVNFLNTTNLVSIIGPNFFNHSAALHQPICDVYAVKTSTTTAYVSCSISKSSFTLFFSCYLVVGAGYLVYFSSSNYVYVNNDGSLVLKSAGTNYSIGSKLYFNVCSTFSITYDGSNVYVVLNGFTKLVIKGTISISNISLGGNGSDGYSTECYFFDLFLLPSKPPLYSYYLHNTKYNSINFFRESGYDNNTINGYLTHWPEVIFAGDQAIFKSNMDIIGWKYYRPVLITNSGTTTYYGNVLINLSIDDFGNPYKHINDDGSDLYFVSSNGIELEHYVYMWDDTGNSEIVISS